MLPAKFAPANELVHRDAEQPIYPDFVQCTARSVIVCSVFVMHNQTHPDPHSANAILNWAKITYPANNSSGCRGKGSDWVSLSRVTPDELERPSVGLVERKRLFDRVNTFEGDKKRTAVRRPISRCTLPIGPNAKSKRTAEQSAYRRRPERRCVREQ